jgi:molybdopterin-binding protein
MLSARNQLPGTVRSIRKDKLLAEVVVDVGDFEVVAVITRDSVERLGLRKGKRVTAIIKATEVMISKQ